MNDKVKGKKVAILATDGFEQVELEKPKQLLENAGAATVVVSPKAGQIRGWDKKDWGDSVKVDATLAECSPDEFDALLLPGGVINPDKLRTEKDAVEFVRSFYEAGKPIGAICHGPWMLVEAGVVEGRRATSWPSLSKDMENAGAEWVDEEVVVDEGIVTSRKPEDIPAFAKKLIEEIGEGKHPRSEPVTGVSR
jgi:protease I